MLGKVLLFVNEKSLKLASMNLKVQETTITRAQLVEGRGSLLPFFKKIEKSALILEKIPCLPSSMGCNFNLKWCFSGILQTFFPVGAFFHIWNVGRSPLIPRNLAYTEKFLVEPLHKYILIQNYFMRKNHVVTVMAILYSFLVFVQTIGIYEKTTIHLFVSN